MFGFKPMFCWGYEYCGRWKIKTLCHLHKCPQANNYARFLVHLPNTHERVLDLMESACPLGPAPWHVLARFACLWLCIYLSLNRMCFWLPYFCCYTKNNPKLLESFMIQNRTLVLLCIENGSLNFIMASNYFTFACVIYYYFIAI